MKLSLLTSLTSMLLAAAPLAAQTSILPYLPKNTLMAMSAPDLNGSMADFAAMPLAKMWAEDDVQAFFAEVKTMVGKQIEKGMAQAKEMQAQGALPFDPELLMQLRVQGVTFALTHLELTAGDFGPMPKIGMVLHLDFGQSAETWNKLVQTGLGMLEAQAGEMMTKKESKVGDVSVLSFQQNNAEGLEMGLNVAMVPGGMLIGTLADEVNSIVDGMQKKTPVLGATEQYMASTKRLGAPGAEFEMFMRMDPMVDFAVSALRMGLDEGGVEGVNMDGVERALDAMGMRKLGTMAASSSYVNGKCVTRSFHSPSAAANTAAPKAIDTAFLKWVPKDAVGFSASTMDVMSIHDTLMKGLDAYDAEFAKQVKAQIEQIEKQLGFSIRNDLFGAFGDHYIYWSMPMGSIAAPPELAVLVKVTDDTKIVTVLKSIAKMSNGILEIEEGEKRGLKAWTVKINFDPGQGMGGFNVFDMVTPTFSFKNGYMVVGMSPSDVKRVFQRLDREDDPKNDIRGNKEFAAIANSIPAGVQSLSFTDWKSDFESMYSIATGLLAVVPIGEDVPINTQLLPDASVLTKHLFASVSYSKSDATGSESITTSPFGPEVGLLLGAAFGAAGAVLGASARRNF